ncbi:MAG TPA: M15 family metallopeptidase [Silvibacterium sp.]|nr:M15 family metallopeptidase [Silvibacterium sp.]
MTKAHGGQSNHNFGVAWDLGVFRDSDYIPESTLYQKAGAIRKLQGLEWGGDWESFQDEPHFQVIAEARLAETRLSFEAGQPFLT